MSNPVYIQLSEYYKKQGIHPERFNCRHRSTCRSYAYQGRMTETKMSLVGSCYGSKYPRIVMLSLDPPLGEKGNFIEPRQRTTEYVTAITEGENYTVNRPNVHWAMTQIIVKDILCLYGYPSKPGSAVVPESYSGRPIENVTPYFAHVNAAKCSMNNPDKGQAEFTVHDICSRAYLLQEMVILQPDILVSQGKSAKKIVSDLLRIRGGENLLPNAFKIRMGIQPVLWLPMDHPSRHTGEIRQRWPYYIQAIKIWEGEK